MFNRRVFLKSSALAMVGVGATPAWLSRALYAADAPTPRKKVLVAIFQRGAVDGLNVVVPHGEKRYYELRPTIAIPRPERHARYGDRPRRLVRPAPVAFGAQADLRCGTTGDRPSRRLARPDALAFRRAGLYGIRHARPQGDHRWLAESGSAQRIGQAVAGARDQHGSGAASRAARAQRCGRDQQSGRVSGEGRAQLDGLREHVRQFRRIRS